MRGVKAGSSCKQTLWKNSSDNGTPQPFCTRNGGQRAVCRQGRVIVDIEELPYEGFHKGIRTGMGATRSLSPEGGG